MCRKSAAEPEVAWGVDNPDTKMLLPNPIHNHPPSQRVSRFGKPLSKRCAAFSVSGGRGAQGIVEFINAGNCGWGYNPIWLFRVSSQQHSNFRRLFRHDGIDSGGFRQATELLLQGFNLTDERCFPGFVDSGLWRRFWAEK